jgi:hypothetical protein
LPFKCNLHRYNEEAEEGTTPAAPVSPPRNPALVLVLLARVCEMFMDDLERATCTEAEVQHEDDQPAISLFEWMINGMWWGSAH